MATTYCCAPTDTQKDEDVEFYREKFAGSQADRLVKAEAEAKKITEKLTEAKISGSLSLSLSPVSVVRECMLLCTLFFPYTSILDRIS